MGEGKHLVEVRPHKDCQEDAIKNRRTLEHACRLVGLVVTTEIRVIAQALAVPVTHCSSSATQPVDAIKLATVGQSERANCFAGLVRGTVDPGSERSGFEILGV